MPKLLQKIIFSLLAFTILFGSSAPYLRVLAVPTNPPPTTPSTDDPAAPAETGTWYNSNFKDWWAKVYDSNVSPENEIFGERYTAAQVQWVIYGLFAFIINSSTNTDVLSCLISNAANLNTCKEGIEQLLKPSAQSGASVPSDKEGSSLTSLIFQDRDLSGITYIKHKIGRFSLVPEAKAQDAGFGFGALESIQVIWAGMRNIAFGLFVIAAVIFAFMIMFRVKINPQTVITIQSAIPKLVIALILVTFSYAIAGLLIDFMYLVIGLLSLVFAPMIPAFGVAGITTPTYNAVDTFRLLTTGTIKFGFNFFEIGIPLGIYGLIMYLAAPVIIIVSVFWALMVALIPVGGMFPFLFATLLLIIVVVTFLWMGIKTVWALFKAFANVIILTIFAPLQIVVGVLIPSLSFGQWVKNYLANLSVFVVTGILWLLSWIFSLLAVLMLLRADLSDISAGEGGWPPLLGFGGGGILASFVLIGASFVFFTLIPKATEVIQGFISGKPFAYGTAIGEFLGPTRLIGKYGAAEYMNIKAEAATRLGKPIPALVQLGRNVLGLKG